MNQPTDPRDPYVYNPPSAGELAAMHRPIDPIVEAMGAAKQHIADTNARLADEAARRGKPVGEAMRRMFEFADEQTSNPAVDAINRIVERRVAAGFAAEEATIRAELVAAIKKAWDEDPSFEWYDVDPNYLAAVAVDTLVAFISKSREHKPLKLGDDRPAPTMYQPDA